jgi:hypothetical protein
MIHKYTLALLLLIFLNFVNGQKPFREEVFWGIWHPFAAIKVKKMYSNAQVIYKQPTIKLALDSFNNGGKLDAFRHAFFMAAFAQKIKTKKLKKLGIAHEKGNYRQFKKNKKEEGEQPDSLSNVMDLKNNELGLNIGTENKKLSLDELKQKVIKEINAGKAIIIKRDNNGHYVDCNNQLIDQKLYVNKWYVPKCLVLSDYIYNH